MFAKIAGTSAARPPHRISARETVDLLCTVAGQGAARRAPGLVEGSRIGSRSIAAPVGVLRGLSSLRERAELHERCATALAAEAARGAIERAGVDPAAIDLVATASTTGFASPDLAARVADRLRLTNAASRVPLAPQGCVGGLAALRLATGLVESGAVGNALVVGVEVPSVWLPVVEPSPADLVAIAQMGDGAGAVVVSAQDRAGGAVIRAAGTALLDRAFPGGGFTLTETGPRFLPARGLEALLSRELPSAVDEFLARAGCSRREVDRWLVHPRNASLLEAAGRALDLSDGALEPSRALLGDAGNTIAASAFLLLDRELRADAESRSGRVLLLAVGGAGVSCELVLLDVAR